MLVFLKKNWPTMRNEVCQVLLDILNCGIMPLELNMTYVALILEKKKKKNLTSVTEFRPISLCNVLYKLISKVLANRIKKILPHLIAPTQSAFILGCLISDNVLAAYETMHSIYAHRDERKKMLYGSEARYEQGLRHGRMGIIRSGNETDGF